MKITVSSTSQVNGVLNPKHGAKGPAATESPQLSWTAVTGAKSYAVEMIDYEATTVIGVPFIHWLVADIKTTSLAENASAGTTLRQGSSSGVKGDKLFSSGPGAIIPAGFLTDNAAQFFGANPPDRDHTYTFRVYALNVETLGLPQGFLLSDLHRAMRGKIIAEGKLELLYKLPVANSGTTN